MKDVTPETVAAQAGGAIDEATGAIVPPMHLATTFLRDPDNQYRRGYCYGRADNATVRQVEDVLTQLEGGARSLVLGSGMTAATTAFLALERPAHVVAPNVMYWGLRKWLLEDAPSLGIEATFVDADDPGRHPRCRTARPHQARVDRDAGQSAVDHHRHRGGGPHRPRCGRGAGASIPPCRRLC